MIGIVILGHADYPSGLKSAIELLVGNPENFEALGLYQGESPDDYKSKISLLIDQVDDGDGVLVLVDLFGGTPSNTIAQIVSLNKIFRQSLEPICQWQFMQFFQEMK